jgi:hypothetical protein
MRLDGAICNIPPLSQAQEAAENASKSLHSKDLNLNPQGVLLALRKLVNKAEMNPKRVMQ